MGVPGKAQRKKSETWVYRENAESISTVVKTNALISNEDATQELRRSLRSGFSLRGYAEKSGKSLAR